MSYRPQTPYNVPMLLQIPVLTKELGFEKKTYTDGELIFGSFRTFGGTERDVNGVYSIENTGTIETWYRPDIKSDCHITIPSLNTTFSILGEPENINMQNQRMKFKVIAIKGGA